MTDRELPQWAIEMPEEEWIKLGKEHKGYRNCSACGTRLILTLCRHDEDKYYCFKHCHEHKWQSDYDWSPECAKCGVRYSRYLEFVLEEHKIEYNGLES